MRDETVAGFLRQLAARTAAPGGGSAAGLNAAQGAALIAMVARFSDRPGNEASGAGRVAPAADALRQEALRLAEADAEAYGQVIAAIRLSRQSPQDQRDRAAAISRALAGACRPPADLLLACARLTALAEELLPAAGQALLGDLAAAAACLRAAADIARVNVEANLAGLAGTGHGREAQPAVPAVAADAAAIIIRCDHLVAAVRDALAHRPSGCL